MNEILWALLGAAGGTAATLLARHLRLRRDPHDDKRAKARHLLRLKSVVDAMPDGVVIGDMDGNLLDWNRSALRMHGFAETDDLRYHVKEFQRLFVFRHDDAVVPFEQWPYPRIMRGETVRSWDAEVERKDTGTRIRIRYDGIVVPDPDGGTALVLFVLRDRTADHHAAEERARVTDLLQAVTSSMGDSVHAKDLDGRYLFANQGTARAFGLQVAQIVGKRHDELATPSNARVVAEIDRAVIASGGPQRVEFTVDVNGEDRTYSSNRAPLRDAEGRIIGIVAVSHDVTEQRRTANALRESQDRLVAAQRIARLGHWYWEPSTGKVWWSDELRRLFGVDATFVPSRDNYLTLVHPDDRARIDATIATVFTGAMHFEHDLRIVRPDGSTFWCHTAARATRDPTGNLVRLEGIDQDVTDRMVAEQSLRTSEERLRQFVEHTPAPVAMLDRDMRYLHVSQRWRTDFALGDQPLIGRCHYDLFPEISEDWKAIHRRCIGGDVACRERDLLRRANGHEQWLRWEVRPWRDSKNEIGGILIFSEDITSRVAAEEPLRQSEQRFRSLVGILPSAVVVERAGAIEYANAAFLRLVGDTAEQVVGRAVTDFLPRAYVELMHARRTMVPAKFPPMVLEQPVSRLDGGTAAVEIVGLGVVDRGEPAIVYAMHDLADRKRTIELTQQFHQAQKMESLGRLAGGIAHDFNNLLTVINGHAELLPDLRETERAESLSTIQDAGKRAARLTQQLLAFSRMAVIEPRIVDMHDLLRQSERLLARVLGEDVVLSLRTEATRTRLRIDPGQFEQAVLNLAVNARDAMPTGGELAITTRDVEVGQDELDGFDDATPGSYVELAVRDSGFGMPPHVLARLFEPFFTTKPIGRGTGLGLSVVHGVVRQSGGLVRVRSQEGVGTTFRLLFPVVDGPVTADAAVPTPDDLYGDETVLLVEDEQGVRAIARLALQDHGYHVIEAANGDQAIEMLRNMQQQIDLLITDVVMPGAGGRLVANVATTERPEITVLYMTGYNDDAVLRHGVATGDALLQKPFTPIELLRKVRTVLDGG